MLAQHIGSEILMNLLQNLQPFADVSQERSLTTLLGTPIPVLIHAVIPSANRAAAAVRCMRSRASRNVYVEHQNFDDGISETGDLLMV